MVVKFKILVPYLLYEPQFQPLKNDFLLILESIWGCFWLTAGNSIEEIFVIPNCLSFPIAAIFYTFRFQKAENFHSLKPRSIQDMEENVIY